MIGKTLFLLLVSCLAFTPLASHGTDSVPQQSPTNQKEQRMDLGNFSVSLAVKDIEASRSFYEKFGFKVFMGDAKQREHLDDSQCRARLR